jgi:hypothetical protein
MLEWGRDRRPGGPSALDGLRPEGLTRWLGRMSTRTAVLVLVAGTLLGVVFTLIAGQEPGGLLGFFLIVGAIAAALGIQRGKVYLLFPAPALAFFVAAIVTGKVHDAKLGSSTAGLGAGFTQWIAGIFFPAVVGTILVLLVGGGRWLLGRQLVTGQSPLSASRPAAGQARPAPRDRRPAVDSWADDDPFDGTGPRPAKAGPAPRQDRPAGPGGGARPGRPGRPPRDQGTDRDPWGDPRLPADRSQPPTGPRPQANGQSRSAPQPRDRPARPSANPGSPRPQRPPRPPRPQPPDGWGQR